MTASRAPSRAAGVVLLLGLLLAAPPSAAAAEQPTVIPGDFSNGQDNAFGRIAMEPYPAIGKQPRPLEASLTLRDLDTLSRAANVLVAFNLKSEDVTVRDETLTAGGKALAPVQEDVVRGGLQRQRFFAAADLLAAAKDGQVDLRLSATASAAADGQFHVGVLLILFDAGWSNLRTADGAPAELYGFSLLMADGISGSFVPFHGQGNSWLALLLLAVCAIGSVAGSWALSASRGLPRPAGTPPVGRPAFATPPVPAPATARAATPASAPAAPAPAQSPPPGLADVPVFGLAGPAAPPPAPRAAVLRAVRSPRSPPARQALTMPAIEAPTLSPGPAAPVAPAEAAAEPVALHTAIVQTRAPVQGPRLPPGFQAGAWRPTPMRARAGAPRKLDRPAASPAGRTPARRPGQPSR